MACWATWPGNRQQVCHGDGAAAGAGAAPPPHAGSSLPRGPERETRCGETPGPPRARSRRVGVKQRRGFGARASGQGRRRGQPDGAQRAAKPCPSGVGEDRGQPRSPQEGRCPSVSETPSPLPGPRSGTGTCQVSVTWSPSPEGIGIRPAVVGGQEGSRRGPAPRRRPAFQRRSARPLNREGVRRRAVAADSPGAPG